MEEENVASGSAPVTGKEAPRRTNRLKLTKVVFRDNELTEGGRVKSRNEVLSYRVDQCGTQPHVNCRVQSFGLIVERFCELKKKWVSEMGLSHLLHLRGKSLPRGLCYWLMTKVDPVNKVFIPSAGREYLLHKNQVHWVLGIPCGPKRVPRKAKGQQGFVDGLYERYGVVTEGKTRYLSMARVMDMVEGDCHVEDEEEFKTAFLALALADVLCPTTCMRLASNLIPALSVAKEAAEYDWSGLVLEKLMTSARSFAMNFYSHGYAKGCGGCTYFLAIYYLDRLNRIPVQWGVFPRIRAWADDDVNKAKNEDKLELRARSDFGRNEFLDLAYGEQHPRAARDTLGPQSLAAEVARHLVGQGLLEGLFETDQQGEQQLEGDDAPMKNRKGRRKGPADNSNPYVRMLAKKARAEASDSRRQHPVYSGQSDRGGPGGVLGEGQDLGELGGSSSAGVSGGGRVLNSDQGGGNISVEEGGVSDGTLNNLVASIAGNTFAPQCSPASNYHWSRQNLSSERFVRDEVHDSGWCSRNLETNFNNADVHLGLEDDRHSGDESVARSAPQSEVEEEVSNTDEEFGQVLGGHPKKQARKLGRSRPRRGKKPSGTMKNKEFVVEIAPRRNPNLKSKLVRFVKATWEALDAEIQLQPTDRVHREDFVMLKHGALEATLTNCYTVLAPTTRELDQNYVRVAAAVYTSGWKVKYGDNSVRYMIEPSYSRAVLDQLGPPSEWQLVRELAATFASKFVGMPAERFQVIFIPVLQQGGTWWCAAFCVNTEEVWVIDATVQHPTDVHDPTLHGLSFGLDILLHAIDSSWKVGTSAGWIKKPVHMDPHPEGSGVRMLVAVKACADRYTTEITSSFGIEKECAWMLADDVMNDMNEVKGEVKDHLSKFPG